MEEEELDNIVEDDDDNIRSATSEEGRPLQAMEESWCQEMDTKENWSSRLNPWPLREQQY